MSDGRYSADEKFYSIHRRFDFNYEATCVCVCVCVNKQRQFLLPCSKISATVERSLPNSSLCAHRMMYICFTFIQSTPHYTRTARYGQRCPGPRWKLTTLPRHPSGLGKRHPYPYPTHHLAPTHLRRLPCVPRNSSQIHAYGSKAVRL